MKKNKGITLVSLSVTVILLIIISSILVIDIQESLDIKNFQKMKSDIELLKDKVLEYYIENGEIPKLCLYSNTDNIEEKSANDKQEYYVIDLLKLKDISINYGREYDKISEYINSIEESNIEQEEIAKYTDIYIIDIESFNIYYPKGIKIENTNYYTDKVDKTEIQLEEI